MSRFLVRMFSVLLLLALALALGGAARPVAAARSTGSISGRVINDIDGDGDTSDAEPGLAGWRVKLELYDPDGATVPVAEAKTDRSGRYSFRGLPAADSYRVTLPCEGQPSDWIGTDSTDYSLPLQAGESEEVDFWVRAIDPPLDRSGSIVGRLVWDENGNTVPEPSERGIAGWKVRATIDNSPVCVPEEPETAVSDSDGSFRFTHLLPGSYDVYAEGAPSSSGPAHWALDAPGVAMDCGGYECFGLQSNIEVPARGTGSILFSVLALEGSSSISGAIYRDLNENGKRDPDDPLLDHGCQIGLVYRTPGGYSMVSPDTFTIPAGGRYELVDLPAGDYRVDCLFGPGGPSINPPAGPSGFPDYALTLGDGERRTGVDFGFGPAPPEPTDEPPPTPESSPTALTPPPTPVSTPAPSGAVTLPSTGSGAAPSDSGLAGFAPALAVAGALVVSGAALLYRRQTRARRAHPPVSE
jgi:hypothetical protein